MVALYLINKAKEGKFEGLTADKPYYNFRGEPHELHKLSNQLDGRARKILDLKTMRITDTLTPPELDEDF